MSTFVATYEDPRAQAVRERYLGTFGGEGLPVPVEAIAEDLFGLRIEERWDIDCSGMLLPAERRIVLNAAEKAIGRDTPPLRRFRFTIAHEIGHWVCQVREGRGEPIHCRIDAASAPEPPSPDPREREANVFAAELLMPEPMVRRAMAEGAAGSELEALFGVSEPAMAWRLYNLGIASSPPSAA